MGFQTTICCNVIYNWMLVVGAHMWYTPTPLGGATTNTFKGLLAPNTTEGKFRSKTWVKRQCSSADIANYWYILKKVAWVGVIMVKLTAELIEQAAQFTNPVRDRELDLRGTEQSGLAHTANVGTPKRWCHSEMCPFGNNGNVFTRTKRRLSACFGTLNLQTTVNKLKE